MGESVLTKKERHRSHVPDYKRIENSLRERINSGHWRAGVILPSRRDLAHEYDVDVNTLQRAIGPLLQEGTLRTNGNRGTFVAGSAPTVADTAAAAPRRQRPASSRLPAATATIGLIAAVEPGHFWTEAIFHAIESTLSLSGATTRFFDTRRDDPQDEMARIPLREAALSLLNTGVDGLIVVGIYDRPGLTEEVGSLLSLTHIPIAYISWHDTLRPVHHVFYDSQFAGYQAAQHLIECGYDGFAFIAPFTADWVAERIESARMALKDAGLPESALGIYPQARGDYQFGNHFDDGYRALQQAVRDGLVLDGKGVIASNDNVAHGMIAAAREIGKVAGQDFGLIGFDDDKASRSLGLTTVRPPLQALAAESARLVLSAIAGEGNAMQIRLHSRLISRSTTCSQKK